MKSSRLTLDSATIGVWPLYEVVNGKYRITYKPREKKPVEYYLKQQARYRHLFKAKASAFLLVGSWISQT